MMPTLFNKQKYGTYGFVNIRTQIKREQIIIIVFASSSG